MTASSTSGKTLWQRLWIAIRFVVFGVGGFLLLMFCWIALIEVAFAHGERLLNPVLALPLGLIGALMMLFGVGEWGHWAYLWVFLSTPIVVSLLLLIPTSSLSWGGDKGVGALVFRLPLVVSYMLVRRYYRRSNVRSEDITHP